MYPPVPHPAFYHEDAGFLTTGIWNHGRSALSRFDLIAMSILITAYYSGSRVNGNLFERYHIRVCVSERLPCPGKERPPVLLFEGTLPMAWGGILHNHELYVRLD